MSVSARHAARARRYRDARGHRLRVFLATNSLRQVPFFGSASSMAACSSKYTKLCFIGKFLGRLPPRVARWQGFVVNWGRRNDRFFAREYFVKYKMFYDLRARAQRGLYFVKQLFYDLRVQKPLVGAHKQAGGRRRPPSQTKNRRTSRKQRRAARTRAREQ